MTAVADEQYKCWLLIGSLSERTCPPVELPTSAGYFDSDDTKNKTLLVTPTLVIAGIAPPVSAVAVAVFPMGLAQSTHPTVTCSTHQYPDPDNVTFDHVSLSEVARL
jgi:hypothetical protein